MKLAQTEVYEVATFYAHFDVVKEDETPPPPVTVRVCDSLSCAMAGAEKFARAPARPARQGRARRARAVHGRVRQGAGLRRRPRAGDAGGRDAWSAPRSCRMRTRMRTSRRSISTHIARRAATRCSANVSQAQRTRENTHQGGRRCGPARPRRRGLPDGRKWTLVRQEPAPRLMAVNGDEGEPGTFKDRYYLGLDPHRFIEGMLIAAWVVEAADIYVYIRDEYPELIADAARGIRSVVEAGSRRTRRSICAAAPAPTSAAKSAMIESIEGKRGLPRHRPPYVAQVGLFGRPTLEQNVETLYWVRDIVEKGAAWFTSHGRRERKGFRSFSVSGRVKKPGVVLAPAGVTARELIEEYLRRHDRRPPSRATCRAAPPAASCRLDGGRAARLRNPGKIRLLRRFPRGRDPVRRGRHEGRGAQPDALLRGRKLRPVHAVPRRNREGRRADGTGRGTRRC